MEAWIPALSFASLVGAGPLYTACKSVLSARQRRKLLVGPPPELTADDVPADDEKETDTTFTIVQPPMHQIPRSTEPDRLQQREAMSEEAFLWCAASNNLEAVCRGIQTGVDVNLQDRIDGCTALFVAAEGGFEPMVEFLLSNGANCELRNNKGCSPLFIASMKDNIGVVEMLLKYDADVNSKTAHGLTPVFIALLKGHAEVAEMLLERALQDPSFDIDQPVLTDGWTLLHAACESHHLSVVALLVQKYKALLDVRASDGSSPLFIAVQEGQADIVSLLLEVGADANLSNTKGATPLYLATLLGHHAIVQLLLPVVREHDDIQHALQLAVRLKRTDLVPELYEALQQTRPHSFAGSGISLV